LSNCKPNRFVHTLILLKPSKEIRPEDTAWESFCHLAKSKGEHAIGLSNLFLLEEN
jgi:hypothetical protein